MLQSFIPKTKNSDVWEQTFNCHGTPLNWEYLTQTAQLNQIYIQMLRNAAVSVLLWRSPNVKHGCIQTIVNVWFNVHLWIIFSTLKTSEINASLCSYWHTCERVTSGSHNWIQAWAEKNYGKQGLPGVPLSLVKGGRLIEKVQIHENYFMCYGVRPIRYFKTLLFAHLLCVSMQWLGFVCFLPHHAEQVCHPCSRALCYEGAQLDFFSSCLKCPKLF